MTFDALAMHAVRDEIERDVLGGHVDSAVVVDDRRVALEIYRGQRRFLVLSVDPNDSRVYLTAERVRAKSSSVTPFSLLLRKYVSGSRLVSIDQPRLERLYCLGFSSSHSGLPRRVELYVETMGRRSNLVLVDEDGTIMDALMRAPPSANPARPVLPHLRYQLPPRATKRDPLDPGLASWLAGEGRRHTGTAWSLLVREAAGLSPLAAREALARAGCDTEVQAATVQHWEAVAGALRELVAPIDSGTWEPCIAWENDAARAFAPYEIKQFPGSQVQHYATMSEVVALAGGPSLAAPPLDRLKRPLLDAIAARADAARRKRSALERSLAAADRAEQLRESGEAILASLHRIPPGATSLDWNGARIDLYPSLSAKENAQAYFRQYADARSARRTVPPLLNGIVEELDYLDEMAVLVEVSQTEREIVRLRAELEAQGIHSVPRASRAGRTIRKAQDGGPVRRIPLANGEILVGASALGNDSVTFRLAQPEDLWFHARAVPGAHVVLRTRGAEPSPEWIATAARVAAQHCAARHDTRVEVDYTRRKHVRKLRGSTPGRVTYRHESTITVDPSVR